MKHQQIHKELGISYKYYSKLRSKYKFFAYITDLLTLDYVLNLDELLAQGLLNDLKLCLTKYKGSFSGLELALFGNLVSFDNVAYLKSLTSSVDRFQEHKWHYANQE